MADYEQLTCPFCKEDDFDAIGLKLHLLRGWCSVFEDTDTEWQQPEEKASKR